MGALENARFAEEAVTLAPGDAFAVFSDGLTECGPLRTAMLGIEGVTALFAGPPPAEAQGAQQTAEGLARNVIAGVDDYAQGSARDDVVLLVGVVP